MERSYRIHVRTPQAEIEIEAPDMNSIDEVIDAASRLLNGLTNQPIVQGRGVERQPAEVDRRYPSVEIPDIKIDKEDSLPSILVKMFSTQWGRKPRKLMEVKETLDSYGIIHPKQSVAVALMRLAKYSKLRRFKMEGEYVYVAGSELVANGDDTGDARA